MDIGRAVLALIDGKTVARSAWNAPHRLHLQVPNLQSKMTVPYVYMETAQGELVPWLCSQSDLLALDWFLVE